MRAKDKVTLRKDILRSLRKQGYVVRDGRVALPEDTTKDDLRRINEMACMKKRQEARPRLIKYEDQLLNRIAAGDDVVVDKVQPKLIQVERDTEDELLFRYVCLHWSIPVSSGYGRRLRFLVEDQSNGKLIGIFGLGDPVYSLRARDQWIGWDAKTKKERLYLADDAITWADYANTNRGGLFMSRDQRRDKIVVQRRKPGEPPMSDETIEKMIEATRRQLAEIRRKAETTSPDRQ